MPLLMCPDDNSAMQTVDRAGVQFDMCPTCRGVWLDRGELEKLMASAVADAPQPQHPQHPQAQQPYAAPQGIRAVRNSPRPRNGARRASGERGEYGSGSGASAAMAATASAAAARSSTSSTNPSPLEGDSVQINPFAAASSLKLTSGRGP